MNTFIFIANFIGVIAFAISGAIKGIKHKLDILGIVVLAVVTAVGGGIIRDTLLNKIPFVLLNTIDIYVATITAIIIFLISKYNNFSKNNMIFILLVMDAVGLAIFTVIGAKIAILSNLNVISVAIISTITGVGGGVIRDILVGEIPIVLKEDVYAFLCFFGAILYNFLLLEFKNEYIISIIIFSIILIIRIIVIKYKLNLPK